MSTKTETENYCHKCDKFFTSAIALSSHNFRKHTRRGRALGEVAVKKMAAANRKRGYRKNWQKPLMSEEGKPMSTVALSTVLTGGGNGNGNGQTPPPTAPSQRTILSVLTPEERAAVLDLAMIQDLTPVQVVKQALRHYQAWVMLGDDAFEQPVKV